MSDKARNNIITTVVVLLIIGILIAVFYKPVKNLITQNELYTAEQIDEAYNKGLADAETNEDYYIDLSEQRLNEINSLNEQLTEKKKEITTLENQITTLENQNKNNLDTIEQLESKIEELKAEASDLETTISELEAEIQRLNAIIEEYEKHSTVAGTFTVIYKVGTVTENVEFVENNAHPLGYEPKDNPPYTFVGWSLNGEDIVNPIELTITNHITLIAVFELDTYGKALFEAENYFEYAYNYLVEADEIEPALNPVKSTYVNKVLNYLSAGGVSNISFEGLSDYEVLLEEKQYIENLFQTFVGSLPTEEFDKTLTTVITTLNSMIPNYEYQFLEVV